MSSVKKVSASILLGGLNSFLLIIIPFLISNRYTHEILDSINTYLTNVFGEFLIGILVIGGLLALFIWMLIKYFNILSNSTLIESLVCSIFYIISWIIVMFLMVPISNLEYFWVFAIFIVLFYIIVFVVIYIISIIIIFKTFSKDKKTFVLITGLLVYMLIPIYVNIIMSGSFTKIYTDDELLKDFNKKINNNNSIIIDAQTTSCEVNSNENDGTTIYIGDYILDGGKYQNAICDKGAKLYLIKVNSKYYKVGSFVGKKSLIPTKQFEILDEYTTIEYELELKEKELIKEIETIAKDYGYSENGNLVSFDKGDIFITKVIITLEEFDEVVMVNWLQYSNEIDVRLSNYKDKITINLNWYIEN